MRSRIAAVIKKSSPLRVRSGFSLIEVVVSIALLAIVLLVMTNTLITGLDFIASANRKTQKSNRTAGGVAQYTISSGTNTYSGVSVGASSGVFQFNYTSGGSSSNVTVSGSYVSGSTSGDDSAAYKTFVPSSPVS